MIYRIASLPLLLASALLPPALLVLAGCAACRISSGGGYTTGDPEQTAHDGLPLNFELNKGQVNPQFRFLARGRRFNLLLSNKEIVLSPRDERPSKDRAVRVRLADANPEATLQGLEALPGKVNYFIGNHPEKWLTGVPTYRRVRYSQAYPGIDVVYYGDQGQLENDFVIAPGGDPRRIRLTFEGSVDLEIDDNRDLVVYSAAGEIRWHKPQIYQTGRNGSIIPVRGGYTVKPNREVGFDIENYDPGRTLVIDPVITYSTFMSGQGSNLGTQIAVDSSGNTYLTGVTTAAGFPTTPGSFQTSAHGGNTGDAFVVKLNAAGTAQVYATYLGGTLVDAGLALAVDGEGNAYVTGATQSTDFPTTPGAYQTSYGGTGQAITTSAGDAFVTKINSSGDKLIYSTYLGGNDSDMAAGIAVDSAGNAYVTGGTISANFPITAGAFQTNLRGSLQTTVNGSQLQAGDVFVTKLNASGSGLAYSTLLGGAGGEIGLGIAVDAGGNAFVTGFTTSGDFPTTPGAFQVHFGGAGGNAISPGDAFVTKINPKGSGLVYSTFLGGSSDEVGHGIALDAFGNAYITGSTASTNFPTTPGAFQTNFKGAGGGNSGSVAGDAFITKLNGSGSALVYSTYLGGGLDDRGIGIAIDATGSAYVTGSTLSSNFPITAGATQSRYGGAGGQLVLTLGDAFVAQIDPAGANLLFSTYLGGSADDVGIGIAVDHSGNFYVSGNTVSRNFPTTLGSFQPRPFGTIAGKLFPQGDAFVTRFGSSSRALVFPHVASDSEWHTDIFVLNTTGASATFNLVFHTDTGAPVPLDGNPQTSNVSLPPGGVAFFRTSPASTPNEGWAELDTSAPLSGVAVFGRHGNDGKYYEASALLGAPYQTFTVPFDETQSPLGVSFLSAFAVTNTDVTNAAQISCTAYGSAGNVLGSGLHIGPLNALKHTEFLIDQQFGASLSGQRGTLTCQSTTLVSAVELRAFASSPAVSSMPVIANTALASTSGRQTFPHVASDKEWHTDIFVLNTTGAAVTFSLVFHTDTGAPMPLDGNPQTSNVNLPPNGLAFFRTSAASTPNEGWAELDASVPLSGVAVFGRHGADGKYYEASVPLSAPYQTFAVPFDETQSPNGAPFLNGFAVTNTDANNATQINCGAYDSDGNIIGSALHVGPLSPLQHTEFLIDQQFGPSLSGQRGTLTCRSSTLVSVVELRAFSSSPAVSSMPVIPNVTTTLSASMKRERSTQRSAVFGGTLHPSAAGRGVQRGRRRTTGS